MLYYITNLIIAVILVGWYFVVDVRRSLKQYLLMFTIVIGDLGDIFLAASKSVEEAILANKIVYIGGIFLPLIFLLVIAEIFRIEINKYIKITCFALQSFIFAMVCTIGYYGWYYKGVTITFIDGITVMNKEYGPLHFLYPLTMYTYYAAAIVITIYTIIKKRNVDRKTPTIILVTAGITMFCYAFERIVKLPVELVPLAFNLVILLVIIPLYKSNLYAVTENKEIIGEHLGKVGFITFDTKMRYRGSNEYIDNLFPELKNCRIGSVIKNASIELNQYIVLPLKEFEAKIENADRNQHLHESIKTFKLADKYYDGIVHTIKDHGSTRVGYTIEIVDETEHYMALELSKNYNEKLSYEVDEKTKRIREMQQKTILGIAQMVESRDLSTGGHIKRTSDVVRIFAKKLLDSDLGFSKKFLKIVIRSAPMHDLGKIGVDDAILRKQGRFTDDEYEIMKSHSSMGAKIVREVLEGVEEEEFVKIAENVAHYHHEKVNGKGYPEGLKGDEIPVEARIMALADVFDALVSKRYYKEAYSFDKAFQIIQDDAGTHFDAKLAELFISCRDELEAYYTQEI